MIDLYKGKPLAKHGLWEVAYFEEITASLTLGNAAALFGSAGRCPDSNSPFWASPAYHCLWMRVSTAKPPFWSRVALANRGDTRYSICTTWLWVAVTSVENVT